MIDYEENLDYPIGCIINTLSNGTTVNLDLAGKTITATKGRIYTLTTNATVTLSIADSVGTGTMRFPAGSVEVYDLIWMRANNSVLNVFGGALTADGTNNTYSKSTNSNSQGFNNLCNGTIENGN